MAKCRPTKWLPWALLGAGLPFLAAGWLGSGGQTSDIASRAAMALAGNPDTAWAAVESNGRDFVLKGEGPSQEAVDAAVKAVAGTYGVRTVASVAKVVPPIPLMAPTIESLTTMNASPEIRGTWQEGVAKTLAVTVAGATYKLGESPELTSQAGNWLLKLANPLPEGKYEVSAQVGDGKTQTVAAEKPAEVVVDLTPPKIELPVIPQGQAWPYAITGKWSEEPGSKLSAKVADKTYELGGSPALTTDGAGTYTFAPTDTFAPGTYDVDITATDPVGNVTTTNVPAAIVVAAAPAPEPAPAPAAAPIALTAVPDGTPWPYAITGAFPEADVTNFKAKLANKTYVLGTNPELTSDGKGTFTFNPGPIELKPGINTAWFTAKTKSGEVLVEKSIITIAQPAPQPAPAPEPEPAPAPVPLPPLAIAPVAEGTAWPYAITGAFPEADVTSFKAKLANQTYVLGAGPELTSDGKGTFTFNPGPVELKPGSHTVWFTAKAKTGEVLVDKAAITIPQPEPAPAPEPVPAPVADLAAPTVDKLLDLTGAAIVKGTWPEAPGNSLTIGLGTKTYTLGQDANLNSKNGVWSLIPAGSLKDGIYDVVATVTDAGGKSRKDETLAELEVDAVQPDAPVVTAVSGESPAAITGTWAEGKATGLTVAVPALNLTAVLGAENSPLTSDGGGNWSLALATPLAAGTYEVEASSSDVHGRTQKDTSSGEVVVAAAPEPAPAQPAVVVPERPFDCEATLSRINQVFPVRFGFDLSDLEGIASLALNQYAALLKDPRCANLNVEVAGHADFKGTEEYNQALSERRATTVLAALKEAGVDGGRLSPKGYSENKPLDAAETDEARMKNRRVEITVVK